MIHPYDKTKSASIVDHAEITKEEMTAFQVALALHQQGAADDIKAIVIGRVHEKREQARLKTQVDIARELERTRRAKHAIVDTLHSIAYDRVLGLVGVMSEEEKDAIIAAHAMEDGLTVRSILVIAQLRWRRDIDV